VRGTKRLQYTCVTQDYRQHPGGSHIAGPLLRAKAAIHGPANSPPLPVAQRIMRSHQHPHLFASLHRTFSCHYFCWELRWLKTLVFDQCLTNTTPLLQALTCWLPTRQACL
jgi:hypothetical protein